MNKMLVAVSALAICAVSSVAALAEEAKGTISSIDTAAGTVTLDDGNVYVLPSASEAATLAVGQEVTIDFEEGSDGMLLATSIETAS